MFRTTWAYMYFIDHLLSSISLISSMAERQRYFRYQFFKNYCATTHDLIDRLTPVIGKGVLYGDIGSTPI